MKKIYGYLTRFILIILFLLQVHAISSGANEPIADNELGLTAKDCALQYCKEKDGMALWLTLVNKCVNSPNPYFIEKTIENPYTSVQNYNSIHFNNIVTGSICSMMGLLGLISGYIIGTNEKINKYTKISQNDSEVEM